MCKYNNDTGCFERPNKAVSLHLVSLCEVIHKQLYGTVLIMSKQFEEEVAKAMEEAKRQGKDGVRLIFNPVTCEFEPCIDEGGRSVQSILNQFPYGEDF